MNLISVYKSNHYKIFAIKSGMRIDQVDNHNLVGLDSMTFLPSSPNSLLLSGPKSSVLLAPSQKHHAHFCCRTLVLTILVSGTLLLGSPHLLGSLLRGYLIRKAIHDPPYKILH